VEGFAWFHSPTREEKKGDLNKKVQKENEVNRIPSAWRGEGGAVSFLSIEGRAAAARKSRLKNRR